MLSNVAEPKNLENSSIFQQTTLCCLNTNETLLVLPLHLSWSHVRILSVFLALDDKLEKESCRNLYHLPTLYQLVICTMVNSARDWKGKETLRLDVYKSVMKDFSICIKHFTWIWHGNLTFTKKKKKGILDTVKSGCQFFFSGGEKKYNKS